MSPEAPATPAVVDNLSEAERRWLETVYQGPQPQLTWRSALTGALIGAPMCLSNLYVSLKTSLALGVSLTACLLSFALHRMLRLWIPSTAARPMSLLESNAMQSVASSAGYSTGAAVATANAAYVLVTGHHTNFWVMMAWTLCLSALGVVFAVPVKRQLLNVEVLPFPTGTATAELLRSLHTSGREATASAKAWALALSSAAGGLVALARDGLGSIRGFRYALPSSIALPGSLAGAPPGDFSLSFETTLFTVGAGALMGMRTCCSLLLGALCCFGWLAPMLHRHGQLPKLGFDAISSWSLWPGAALLVAASLTHLLFRGRSLLRTFQGLGRVGGTADLLTPIEVPSRWFLAGVLPLSLATAWLAWSAFDIPPADSLVALALSFVLSLVAARTVGETDVTPTGALGQMTQLTFGVLMPQNMIANLMTASITADTASTAADLLTDLKSGHLLGAQPRQQFLAQLLGCVVGTVVLVPGFYLLVPDGSALGTERLPAPGATMLAGVARVLANGLSGLPPGAAHWAEGGALLGVALTILEHLLPERVRAYVPSAMGLGLAFMLPASTSFSIFLGGLAAWLLTRARPQIAERYTVAVASGLIAGESLGGVLVGLLAATHVFG